MERNPNGAPFNSGGIVDARGEAPARRRARFGDDPQVGPGGDAGPRQFGGGNAQGPGTAHDDIEAVAQSTDPFEPRCPPRLSPGSNCPPMTSRSGPTFSLPAEPGTTTRPGDRMHYRRRWATAGAVPGRPRPARPRPRGTPRRPGHAPRTAAGESHGVW